MSSHAEAGSLRAAPDSRPARDIVRAFVPALTTWRGALLAPFTKRPYLAAGQLGLSAVVGAGPAAAMCTALAYWVNGPAEVAPTVLAAIITVVVVLAVALPLVPWLARAMRWLSAQYDFTDLAAHRYRQLGPSAGRAALNLVRDPARWIDLGRLTVAGLIAALGWLITLGLATVALFYAVIPFAYLHTAGQLSDFPLPPTLISPALNQPVWANLAIGIVLGYVAVLAAPALAHAYELAAHRLLAPLRGYELAERVERLQKTRSEVLDAADSERKRIERDLHDGAQQRLVALSLDLGVARRQVMADPAAALPALEHAQEEVEASLAELRALVRGIYPQVLTERGLHEAAEALVTRSSLPASLVSPGPEALARVPSALSSAAYFVISECLTNAAAHGGASSVVVSIELAEGQLAVSVADDGTGGARLRPGGGLDGLRRRIAALDGSLVLTSPHGAGTTVRAVFPCAS